MRRRFMNPQFLEDNIAQKYFYIECESDIRIGGLYGLFSYSRDGIRWIDIIAVSHTFRKGRTYLKALTENSITLFAFETNQPFDIGGNILSLNYGDDSLLYDTLLYNFKFRNTGVRDASKLILPSKVSHNCYQEMFYGCTSLVNAPELPATTLADNCYQEMFYGCTNLNYIKMLATDISAIDCLYNWVSGVASTGTFVKNKEATWDVVGDSGVPTGWTVITDDQEGDSGSGLEFPLYLEFGNCEDNGGGYMECTRETDEIGVKLFNLLINTFHEYGEEYDEYSWGISEQILDMLGIEIYADNSKVIEGYLYVFENGEHGELILYPEEEKWEVIIYGSGSMLKTVYLKG